MKLIIAPILILVLLGTGYYFYNFIGGKNYDNPQQSETLVSQETTKPQEQLNVIVISEDLVNKENKQIPEWLEKYRNLPADQQYKTVKKILDDRTMESDISDIADNLEIFPEIYKSNQYKNALSLIDSGYGEIVFKNVDKFEINDKSRQEEIISKIRNQGQFYLLAQNFNFFNFSQDREYFYAKDLFEKHPNDFISNFEKFKQIKREDHYNFANNAIDKDKENQKFNLYHENTCLMLQNMYKFYALTEKQKLDLFNRAYDNKFICIPEVLENFDKWNIKNTEAKLDIAAKIIMEGYGGWLPEDIKKFNFNSEQQLLIAQRILDTKNDSTISDLERDVYFFNEDVAEEILRRIKK